MLLYFCIFSKVSRKERKGFLFNCLFLPVVSPTACVVVVNGKKIGGRKVMKLLKNYPWMESEDKFINL